MKKEIIAVVLLVLMFAVSLVNIHFLNKLTSEIAALVEETSEHVGDRDWEKAREKAEKAVEKWEKSDAYTHIVLRHSEIESAGQTLGELLREVYTESPGAARAAAKAAASRMKSVASIEQIKPGSIF